MNANQTIEIEVEGSTDTIIPITTTNIFSIDVQNNSPVFKIEPDMIKVRISDGLSMKVVYSRFCSSTLALISFDDNEGDSIYFTANINNSGYTQSQVVLYKQDWEFEMFISTTSFTPGNYSLKFDVWDIFHRDNLSEFQINLEISYFIPPIFENNLQNSLTVQIWNQTKFNFPNISDADNDFMKIIIKQQK